MIDYIIGKVFRKNGLSTTVLVNNSIGYEVFIPLCFFSKIIVNEMINLDIIHIQKEDGRETLYGFFDLPSKQFFYSLLKVDGISDKKAFSILANNEPSELIAMMESKDLYSLTKVKGVGPKTAQKIIETLEGKIEIIEEKAIFNDVKEALLSLNMNIKDVNNFIDGLDRGKSYTLEGLIQQALTS
jgi:Holliday junction DNA helicase RuvA